mgnify:CR=1 FL=1
MTQYMRSTASLSNEGFKKQARDYYIRFVQAKFVTGKDDFDKFGDIYRTLPKTVKEILKLKAKQKLVEFDIPEYWNDNSVEGDID